MLLLVCMPALSLSHPVMCGSSKAVHRRRIRPVSLRQKKIWLRQHINARRGRDPLFSDMKAGISSGYIPPVPLNNVWITSDKVCLSQS